MGRWCRDDRLEWFVQKTLQFVIARFMRATHFVFGEKKDGLPGQAGQ
jgi:hypothetical protein